MFQNARLKLTAWYLLIITCVSILFSVAIYESADMEFERIQRRQQFRVEHLPYEFLQRPDIPTILPFIDVHDLRERLILMLILINTGIIILAGGLGYFLAGRTLKPIKEMVDEQNRFITDASHELRTPITTLISEIEVNLRDKNLSIAEARGLLGSNLEEAIHLKTITDSLLELSQLEKKNTFTFTIISLREIVESSIRKVQPLAKKKKITFEQKLMEVNVYADKNRLTEVMVILLDNAIKYSPENSLIKITIKSHDGVVSILIKDQGEGIAEVDLDHIFDRFYRVNKSRSKQKVIGYGLGLAIAKKIVDEHKGEISVKSKLGEGSTFSVKLPRKK